MIVLIAIALSILENILLIMICNLGGRQRYKNLNIIAVIILFIQVILLDSSNYGTIAIFIPITTLLLYSFVNIDGATGTRIFYSLIGFLPISIVTSILLVVSISQNIFDGVLTGNIAFALMIVSRVLLFLLYLLLRYLAKINNVIKTRNWILLILILVLSLLAIFVSVYSLIVRKFSYPLIIINVLFILLISIFSLILYFNIIKAGEYFVHNQMLEARLENQQKIHDETLAVYEEARKLKHDLKNHILALADGDKQLMDTYSKQLLAKLDVDDFLILENISLSNILKAKNAACKEKGIRFDLQLFDEFSFMEDVDIISLFSNLIDNAMEAQIQDMENKRIVLRTRVSNQKTILEIHNTIHTSVLTGNEELVTTKQDTLIHGYGLRSVRQVIKKYKGEILFKEDNGYFIVICIF